MLLVIAAAVVYKTIISPSPPSAAEFNEFAASDIAELSAASKISGERWFTDNGLSLDSAHVVSRVNLCYEVENVVGLSTLNFAKECYYRLTAVYASPLSPQDYIAGFEASVPGKLTVYSNTNLPCYTNTGNNAEGSNWEPSISLDYIIASPDTLLHDMGSCKLVPTRYPEPGGSLDTHESIGPLDGGAFNEILAPISKTNYKFLEQDTYSFKDELSKLKANGTQTVLVVGYTDNYLSRVIKDFK